MWGWILAIVVVALVLAPVLWAVPTPVQQRHARLRQEASRRGLLVRVGPLPQTRRQRVRGEEQRRCATYELPIHLSRRAPTPLTWTLWRQSETEDEVPHGLAAALREPAAALLAEMPEDVIALQRSRTGLAVHWRERGDETDVKRIAELLHRLADMTGARDVESGTRGGQIPPLQGR